MKRFTKVCLIICGVLVVLGLIMCVAGVALGFTGKQFWQMAEDGTFQFQTGNLNIGMLGAWDLDEEDLYSEHSGQNEWENNDWSQVSQTWSADEVRSLDIDFNFGSLILESTNSDEIEVSAEYRSLWDKYKRSMQFQMDDGTLEIEDSVDKKISQFFSVGSDDATLIVRIPEGMKFEELSMDIGAAEVEISTQLTASEMEISLGAGKVFSNNSDTLLQAEELSMDIGAGHMEIYGVEVDSLDVDGGTGQVSLYNVNAKKIDADCGIGQMTLQVNGAKEDYNYELDCGIGQILLGDASYSGLGQSTKLQNGADKKMDIDCGIGEISILFEKE